MIELLLDLQTRAQTVSRVFGRRASDKMFITKRSGEEYLQGAGRANTLRTQAERAERQVADPDAHLPRRARWIQGYSHEHPSEMASGAAGFAVFTRVCRPLEPTSLHICTQGWVLLARREACQVQHGPYLECLHSRRWHGNAANNQRASTQRRGWREMRSKPELLVKQKAGDASEHGNQEREDRQSKLVRVVALSELPSGGEVYFPCCALPCDPHTALGANCK